MSDINKIIAKRFQPLSTRLRDKQNANTYGPINMGLHSATHSLLCKVLSMFSMRILRWWHGARQSHNPSETARQRYDTSRNREGHEIPMMPKSSRFLVSVLLGPIQIYSENSSRTTLTYTKICMFFSASTSQQRQGFQSLVYIHVKTTCEVPEACW